MEAIKVDRETMIALLTERAKLAGVFSDTAEFTHHLESECDIQMAKSSAVLHIQNTNRRWRVEHYEARGIPHDHIPVTEI